MRTACLTTVMLVFALIEPVLESASRTSGSVQTALPPSKRVFQLPVYPGTVAFEQSSHLSLLQPPFATIMKVYKTIDGSSLDKERVISFYRDQLNRKGWTDAIFKRRGDEAYLGLTIQIAENLPDGTGVRCAGDFYVWVAPKDGMYTILLKQWRISGSDQSTRNSVSSLTKSLDGIGARIDYRVWKVSEDSWERDYENEYLIDRYRYTFISNTNGPRSDIDPTGLIRVSILTYGDANTANEEATLLRSSAGGGAPLSGDKVVTILPALNPVVVLAKNKTLVVISDSSRKQKDTVEKLASEIEKIW